jgi:fused signal recognition particle receptor
MADEKKVGFFKRIFGFGKTPASDAPAAAEAERIRVAAEQADAERRAADEAAAQAVEAERQAAEQAERAREETERREAARIAEESAAAARAEAERRAAEEAAKAQSARAEAERAAKERERAEAAAAEAARKAAEQAERAREEAARREAALAAEERAAAARAETERRAAEDAAKAQQAEQARTEAAAAEAERKAAERAERAREESARLEAARVAAENAAAAPKPSWWQKLRSGLSRTAGNVAGGITSLFTKRKLDGDTLEELEDLLIQADLGVDVAARISAAVGKGRYDKEIAPDEVKAILAEEVAKTLAPVALPLSLDASRKPFVLLMVGVNGSGKTTTIGKLASKFRAEGRSVMLAAGDTFRAAAIDQLKVWGERTGAPVVARDQGGDAAGLAFDALKAAREQNIDVLMIDTAGRLQNRTELMAELEKVIRVIRKQDETAPHATLLVLDATVGQNALSQVEIFGKTAGVTGLVMTKLDGTARGGILVAIAEKFRLPIHFIGVGEGVDDLEPFEAGDFARAIAGLEKA